MPRKIILDCDPGHDDAFAIFTAMGSPALELVAITTVCGNQTVDLVTRNALAIAEVAGVRDVVIARGAAHPLLRAHRASPEIHGASGLDGPTLPTGSMSVDPRAAAQVIVDLVMAAGPGEITLVATGPLTNLALALALEPVIAQRVAEVVLMGGAITQGNITPSAEFNVHVDPEAARLVFRAPWPVTMMGLEVTHQALATDDVRRRLVGMHSRVGDFSVELLDFFAARYLEHQGFTAAPVHDLCPVVYLIDPSVFRLVAAPIDVEITGELTAGRTVVDLRPAVPADARHQVATGLDHAAFWDIVIGAMSAIG